MLRFGSLAGIATGYGLDCPGFEPRWGTRDFLASTTVQTGPGPHSASAAKGTATLSVGKSGLSGDVDHQATFGASSLFRTGIPDTAGVGCTHVCVKERLGWIYCTGTRNDVFFFCDASAITAHMACRGGVE